MGSPSPLWCSVGFSPGLSVIIAAGLLTAVFATGGPVASRGSEEGNEEAVVFP